MKSRKLSFVHVTFLMLISLFLSFSSLQATFLKEEQELLGEVTRSNIRKVLEKHTGENPDLLNSSKGKDIVVFLGKTGAGKSTLINYLSDKELKVDENGNIVLKNPMDSSAMRIGIGGDSETFLPKFIKSNGLLFYDLAGFGDTRGTAISLVNACFIKNIIENAATARLVFVAGQDEITAGRGELFKQLTMITRDLIPNEIIEKFSSLVITRSTPGRNKQQLINFLQTKTDPEILTPWIEQGRLVKMSSPFGEDIDPNDKANILDALFNTPPQKIKNINIGVIYSDKELSNLRKVYYGEIDDATHGLIRNNFDPNTLSSLDRGTLENKKQYFQSNFLKDVFLSVDTSPLIALLRPISEKIYHSSWDEMKNNIFLTSDKIVGLIDVEIKDQEKKEVERLRVLEENRRIQAEAEIQRIQLENAKKEELMREQLHQAEIRRLEEQNKYLQEMAEKEKLAKQNQFLQLRLKEEEEKKHLAEIRRQEKLKVASIQILETATSMSSCAAEYEIRRQEAQIQQKKHAEEFQKQVRDVRFSAYWEGYALGQQEELKLARDKMYHFSAEIQEIVNNISSTQALKTATSMKSCAAEYEIRRQEAQIQQKKHAEEFQKQVRDIRFSAYWEGYALGQQEELKLAKDKMYHFSAEIEKIANMCIS